MPQYVCGTVTANAPSPGVSVEVKKDGVVEATPTAYKTAPGTFMYSAPVAGGTGYTTKATCDGCAKSRESSPAETVDTGEWQTINVAIPCTCS